MRRLNDILILLFMAVRMCAQLPVTVMSLDKEFGHVLYRPDLGIPQSVEWTVSRSDLGSTKRDPSFRFKSDRMTPKPRITADLYTRTGWQRGHMCPAADCSASKSAMRSTFVMTNVCPMAPKLNTGPWKKTEIMARQLATRYGSCHVVAAPLFFPEDTSWLGGRRVAIPHAFVKFITIQGDMFFCRFYILSNKL